MSIDVSGMSPAELAEVLQNAQAEQGRRSAREEAERRMDEALIDRLNAEAIGPGAPWQEPTGSSSAYPKGFIVGWGGGFRRSAESVNMERPDVLTHWEPVAVEAPTPAGGGDDAA